jgi:hypothetical protein
MFEIGLVILCIVIILLIIFTLVLLVKNPSYGSSGTGGSKGWKSPLEPPVPSSSYGNNRSLAGITMLSEPIPERKPNSVKINVPPCDAACTTCQQGCSSAYGNTAFTIGQNTQACLDDLTGTCWINLQQCLKTSTQSVCNAANQACNNNASYGGAGWSACENTSNTQVTAAGTVFNRCNAMCFLK